MAIGGAQGSQRVRRVVIQCIELFLNRFGYSAAAMSGANAPQTRNAINNLPPIMGREVHPLGSDQYARISPKVAVRCKGQPLVVHVEWLGSHIQVLERAGET